jgi:hypothetical protein
MFVCIATYRLDDVTGVQVQALNQIVGHVIDRQFQIEVFFPQ